MLSAPPNASDVKVECLRGHGYQPLFLHSRHKHGVWFIADRLLCATADSLGGACTSVWRSFGEYEYVTCFSCGYAQLVAPQSKLHLGGLVQPY